VTFQWVTADSNKNFRPLAGTRFGAKARASRSVISLVGAVAELSAIELLIAAIIAQVSSLRKKTSINLELSQS
jgi:hypothetical protein